MASVIPDIDEEIARRMVHMSTSAVPLSYVALDVIEWIHVQMFLSIAVLGAFGLEVIRLFVGLDWWIFDRLTRSYEQDNFAGYFLGGVALTMVALVFTPPSARALVTVAGESPVAVPAMLMLTIGDPFSGLISSGELQDVKQIWVLLATFFLCLLIALFFVPLVPAMLGGLAATVADGVKPVIRGYVIDDNLTIAPAAAVTMFVAITVLPV